MPETNTMEKKVDQPDSLAYGEPTPQFQPEQKEEPKYVMPPLDKGAASFFDPESKCYWIGIPIDRVDFLTSCAILDASHLDLLSKYQKLAIERQNQSRIVSPSKIGGYIKSKYDSFVRGIMK